uniref:hypothetical protein n=1 Tax=uncultured Desulfovibrio sp. TaxID=167968 RepID=UPI002622BC0A
MQRTIQRTANKKHRRGYPHPGREKGTSAAYPGAGFRPNSCDQKKAKQRSPAQHKPPDLTVTGRCFANMDHACRAQYGKGRQNLRQRGDAGEGLTSLCRFFREVQSGKRGRSCQAAGDARFLLHDCGAASEQFAAARRCQKYFQTQLCLEVSQIDMKNQKQLSHLFIPDSSEEDSINSIFDTAVFYSMAGRTLAKYKNRNFGFIFPEIICLGFAIELFFKFFLAVEGNDLKSLKGH